MKELKINNKQKEKIKVKAQKLGMGRPHHLIIPHFSKPSTSEIFIILNTNLAWGRKQVQSFIYKIIKPNLYIE